MTPKQTYQVVASLMLVVLVLAALGCGGGRVRTNLPADDLFALGKKEYDNQKYYKSIEYFQTIVFNHAGASIVDTAQFYLAQSYFGNKDYELAKVEFNRLVTNYPSSDFAVAAQFMKAVCSYQAAPKDAHRDQTSVQEALTTLEDFIIDYPESEFVSDAQVLIADARGRLAKKDYDAAVVYMNIRAYDAAQIYFQKVVDEYTDTEYGPLATYGIAEADYKLKKYASARDQFSRFTKVFADHERAAEARRLEARSAFLDARQAVKQGNIKTASEKLQFFLDEYPDHDKRDEAQRMLEELPAVAADTAAVTNESGQI